jgi:hypothetical protein
LTPGRLGFSIVQLEASFAESPMFPLWIYVAMAAAIAAVAFLIGQAFPGLGVPFVAAATTLWTGYAVYRQRRARHGACDENEG